MALIVCEADRGKLSLIEEFRVQNVWRAGITALPTPFSVTVA